MADEPVTQPEAAPAVEAAPVDAKAARRAERAAKRAAEKLEREGPARSAFVATAAFDADGVAIRPGAPLLLTEAGAAAWAAHVRPATKLDLSAGPSPRPIG